MGSTIWSPLAGGILTGKYNNEIPKDTRLYNEDAKVFYWDTFLNPDILPKR